MKHCIIHLVVFAIVSRRAISQLSPDDQNEDCKFPQSIFGDWQGSVQGDLRIREESMDNVGHTFECDRQFNTVYIVRAHVDEDQDLMICFNITYISNDILQVDILTSESWRSVEHDMLLPPNQLCDLEDGDELWVVYKRKNKQLLTSCPEEVSGDWRTVESAPQPVCQGEGEIQDNVTFSTCQWQSSLALGTAGCTQQFTDNGGPFKCLAHRHQTNNSMWIVTENPASNSTYKFSCFNFIRANDSYAEIVAVNIDDSVDLGSCTALDKSEAVRNRGSRMVLKKKGACMPRPVATRRPAVGSAPGFQTKDLYGILVFSSLLMAFTLVG